MTTTRAVGGSDADAASSAPPAQALATAEPLSARYDLGEALGSGGMGEVRSVHDRRIGRDVALKSLRPELAHEPSLVARFVREARIQGQLEHPTFVPVHDLAVDASGVLYFTMKRVHGVTLTDVLAGLAAGDPDAARFTRHRLLTTFCNVCLAVDFAHTRGVVHRDLKPANIMFGEHGEVYVLDWGVARQADEAATAKEGATSEASGAVTTQMGDIMGTPGYMAPEQAHADPAHVGPRSDVYALGAILFEILTLRPLHEGTTTSALLVSTLRQADARASVRAPEAHVPPELESVCVEATALLPADRLSSAKELAERVEAYLEGERDEQRRRVLSEALVEEARRESAAPGAGTDAALRRSALRKVARALALDPDNALARRTLVDLLVTPPAETPPEVARTLETVELTERRRGARLALLSNGIWLVFVPLGLTMGVRNWPMALTTIALCLLSAAVSFAYLRFPRITDRHVLLLLGLNLLSITSFACVFGPFFLGPTVALANLVMFTLVVGRTGHRLRLALLGAATTLVPFGLELVGVLPPSLSSTPEGLLIHTRMVDFAPGFTTAFLLLTTLAAGPPALHFAEGIRTTLADAERRHLLQAWQLRQTVPDEALKDLDSGPAADAPAQGEAT